MNYYIELATVVAYSIMIPLNISFYNLMGNVFAARLQPLFGAVAEDLHCTLEQLPVPHGYTLPALGLAVSLSVYASDIIMT